MGWLTMEGRSALGEPGGTTEGDQSLEEGAAAVGGHRYQVAVHLGDSRPWLMQSTSRLASLLRAALALRLGCKLVYILTDNPLYARYTESFRGLKGCISALLGPHRPASLCIRAIMQARYTEGYHGSKEQRERRWQCPPG